MVAQGTNKITKTLQIRKQFVEFYTAKATDGVLIDDMPVDDVSVATYMKTLGADGSWPDINYESQRRAKWDVVDHLRRVTAATILNNTESVQAVTLNGDLSAVFYSAGEINFDGKTVRVDKPCLIMQRKGQWYISDPTQKEKTITVWQGKKSTTVKLPTDNMAGSPAAVH